MRKFTATLEPEKRKAASFPWNGRQWRDWDFYGSADFIKPGLRLEQMSAEQKAAAWEVLPPLFSPAGLEKTRNVMLLQDVLAAERQRRGPAILATLLVRDLRHAGRDRRLGLATGRTPSEPIHRRARQPYRLDDAVSFCALPARITTGQHAGLATLKHEEALARTLVADLGPKLQGRTRKSNTPLRISCPTPDVNAAISARPGLQPPSSSRPSATCSGS